MSIQATINQGLSIAGLLFQQTPFAKSQTEKRLEEQKKARDIKQTTSQIKQYEDVLKQEGLSADFRESLGSDLEEQVTNLVKLDPSKENIKKLQQVRMPKPGEGTPIEADPEEIAQEIFESEERERDIRERVDFLKRNAHPEDIAADKAQEALIREQKRRRSFKSYMQDEPVSIGKGQVPLSSLSKSAQSYILNQYSKKEKTDIMNRKDREANG